MKKILLGLLIILVIVPSVISWGANRIISGNEVTINIDNANTQGCIIRETIPASLTVTSSEPQGGTYNKDKGYLKWIFTNCPTSVKYSTSGAGIVSGKMTSGGSEKDITGDTEIPQAGGQLLPCTDKDWVTGLWGECTQAFGALTATQTRAVALKPGVTCTGTGGKPATTQPCRIEGGEKQPAGTIGQQIDAGLGEEKTQKKWTMELISKIAALLKNWFTS